jgi:hypothetical protein
MPTPTRNPKEFDITKETNYWSGYLLESIGRGEFRSGVSLLIQHMLQLGQEWERNHKKIDPAKGILWKDVKK